MSLRAIVAVCLAVSAPATWSTFRNGPANTGRAAISLRGLPASKRVPLRFDTGGLIWGTAVSDARGNSYVGAANKRFYAMDARGNERWHYDVSDRADALIDSAAALAPHNLVVVPGGDGFLHALDRDSGLLVWRFAAHGVSEATHQRGAIVNSFEGNVQVGPDGLLYAGSDNGVLYALDATGRERWSYQTGMMIWSSPALSPDGRWLAFGSLDGHLYLLDAHTGKLLDRFAAGSEVKSSPVLDDRGRVIFGTSQGDVVALKVVNGRLREDYRFHAGAEVYASPALAGDGVVVGALDGNVYALDAKGRQRWVYRTRSRVSASALVSKDGVALVGARNGRLYALDAANGHRLWSFQVSRVPRKANLDASPAVTPDGQILVGAYNGTLTRLPAEYPLTHLQDPRVAVGGTEDWPDAGPALAHDGFTLRYQDREGRLLAAPEAPVGLSPMLRLRLVSWQGGHPREGFAINPGMRASLDDGTPVDVTLASDGRTANVLPRTFLAPGRRYQLHLEGDVRWRLADWWWDRLLPRSGGRFDLSVPFTTDRPTGGTPGHAAACGARGMYLFQPEALETYTPAALDGQAFELVSCCEEPDIGKSVIVGVPALPTPDGVRVLDEPARAFVLNGRWRGPELRADGAFTISAMGGTIPFDRVTMTARADVKRGLVDGELLASAPLWGLKGNGSSFSFPMGLLNEVADHGLRVVAQGTFDNAPIRGRQPVLLIDRHLAPGELTADVPVSGVRFAVAIASHAGEVVASAAGLNGDLHLQLAPGRRLEEANRLSVIALD